MENNTRTSTPGVFIATKKDGSIYYRASVTVDNRHISIGSYDNMENAHRAYNYARLLLSSPQIKLEDYDETRIPISFEKWVVLCNLRDNGLYFHNPIYMGQKMFFYYLSPTQVMKFDLDDLFYYSSHKIQQRGGHLFIADYGSQISLLSRYGIGPYSIEGRDYIFANGDSYDFRHSNIKLIIPYHGVVQSKRGKGYIARIHVRGYLHIGTYDTPIEAAIAYNKAADILNKNGINKNFITNYLPDISPRKFADIYNALKIADKIYSYRI